MKEINDIIVAYNTACYLKQQTALATVVHVEGSSYRRPGARMLVNETGVLTGAISGGCLEGDALKKALLAIHQNKKKVVIYDTTDEDDAKLGIQLGCNGIVSILFEPLPLNASDNNNPISSLRNAIADRKPTLLICGYTLNGIHHFGTNALDELPTPIQTQLSTSINRVNATNISEHVDITWQNEIHRFFIQALPPNIQLLIVGAGNDAIPLAQMASLLGWDVIVADGRKTHATQLRFPMAKSIIIGKPLDVVNQLKVDERTAIVVMTHNYNYDLAMLAALKDISLPYIGLLGPADKRNRLYNDLQMQGILFSTEQKKAIYGPTGLQVGAETAAEIAVSITAEIMTVIHQVIPMHLREKSLPIHAEVI